MVRIVLLASALTVVNLLLWAPGAANRLVTEKPIAGCDLMIILEGGALERIASGVEFHADGSCDKVLVTGDSSAEELTRGRFFLADLDQRHRLQPETVTHSTLGDALLALDVAKREGFNHLLVITSPYHTKRVAWVFSRVLDGTGIEFGVLASQSFYMDYQRWWGTSYGRKAVVVEHAKLWLLGLTAQCLTLAVSGAAFGPALP